MVLRRNNFWYGYSDHNNVIWPSRRASVWLCYCTEACPLSKTSANSLDFVIDRFFMKLFKTNNIDIVRNCQKEFAFELPSVNVLIMINEFALRMA